MLFNAFRDSTELPPIEKYDFDKAKNLTERVMRKDKFWESPSDERGNSFFVSKKDFNLNSSINVIPVVRGKLGVDSTLSGYSYSIDYNWYLAFLRKKDFFLEVILINKVTMDNGKVIYSLSEGETNKNLFKNYKNHIDTFFIM